MLEGVGEREDKGLGLFVGSVVIWLVLVMIINVLPCWFPIVPWLPAFDVGPHTSLEERVQLFEAIDMELHFTLLLVLHAEVKPLAMSLGIWVHSHVKIILQLWNPDMQ